MNLRTFHFLSLMAHMFNDSELNYSVNPLNTRKKTTKTSDGKTVLVLISDRTQLRLLKYCM